MSGCISILLTFVSFCFAVAGGFALIASVVVLFSSGTCTPDQACSNSNPLLVAALGIVLLGIAAFGFAEVRKFDSGN